MLCNKEQDCLQSEDENENLCGINECLKNNGECSQLCFDLPIGHKCECYEGYNLQKNNTCKGKKMLPIFV